MSDNLQGDYGAAVGSFEGMPKASIGNYKGVMLCNRPNEFGQQRRQEPTGPRPFNSRVDPKTSNPMGWNPCQKVFPKSGKRKNIFSGILKRHKAFLRNLEDQKRVERDDMEMHTLYEEQKINRFKDQAEKQRSKIKGMKETGAFLDEGDEMQFDEQPPFEQPVPQAQPDKLSADNLSQLQGRNAASQKSGASKGSKKSKAPSKPAWAMTEKQIDDNKEDEVDNLIEFAYDLDYEKYMEDFEVRQAFEIIKDRIGEIKADQDWKEKIADEWNKTAELEAEQVANGGPKSEQARSVYSYRSGTLSQKSGRSQASYKQRVAAQKKKTDGAQADWERSTVASENRRELTVEDKVAQKIANELLRDNQKLRGVHSNQSMKKILEKEAKRQLLAETNGGVYNPPVMSKINERGSVDKADPSNLPYLHKCPAV